MKKNSIYVQVMLDIRQTSIEHEITAISFYQVAILDSNHMITTVCTQTKLKFWKLDERHTWVILE